MSEPSMTMTTKMHGWWSFGYYDNDATTMSQWKYWTCLSGWKVPMPGHLYNWRKLQPLPAVLPSKHWQFGCPVIFTKCKLALKRHHLTFNYKLKIDWRAKKVEICSAIRVTNPSLKLDEHNNNNSHTLTVEPFFQQINVVRIKTQSIKPL